MTPKIYPIGAKPKHTVGPVQRLLLETLLLLTARRQEVTLKQRDLSCPTYINLFLFLPLNLFAQGRQGKIHNRCYTSTTATRERRATVV